MSKIATLSISIAAFVVVIIMLVILPRQITYFNVSNTCPELAGISEALFADVRLTGILYWNGTLRCARHEIGENALSALGAVPGLRAVQIVEIQPSISTPVHVGSAPFANYTVRCVMPLKAPRAHKVGVWNLGDRRNYTVGKWVIYDDANENYTFNDDKTCVLRLLVLDIDRPANCKLGTATVAHASLF